MNLGYHENKGNNNRDKSKTISVVIEKGPKESNTPNQYATIKRFKKMLSSRFTFSMNFLKKHIGSLAQMIL
jgi:hypothetical protein